MEGSVLIEIDSAVGKLSEGSLLFDFGSLNGVLEFSRSLVSICSPKIAVGSAEVEAIDTHVFVGHDCGSLTWIRFSMLVERRM